MGRPGSSASSEPRIVNENSLGGVVSGADPLSVGLPQNENGLLVRKQTDQKVLKGTKDV